MSNPGPDTVTAHSPWGPSVHRDDTSQLRTGSDTPSATLAGADAADGVVVSVRHLGATPLVDAHLLTGQEALEPARVLAALGSAPAWLARVDHAQHVLNLCPDAPTQEVLDHVALVASQRLGRALDADERTPEWLGWAFAYDPDPKVGRTWADRIPLPEVSDSRCTDAEPAGEPDAQVWEEQVEAMRRDPRLNTAVLARYSTDHERVADVISTGTGTEVAWVIRSVSLPQGLIVHLARRCAGNEFLTTLLLNVPRLPSEAYEALGAIDSAPIPHQNKSERFGA